MCNIGTPSTCHVAIIRLFRFSEVSPGIEVRQPDGNNVLLRSHVCAQETRPSTQKQFPAPPSALHDHTDTQHPPLCSNSATALITGNVAATAARPDIVTPTCRPDVAASSLASNIATAVSRSNVATAIVRANVAAAVGRTYGAAAAFRPNIAAAASRPNIAAAASRPNIAAAAFRPDVAASTVTQQLDVSIVVTTTVERGNRVLDRHERLTIHIRPRLNSPWN